MLPSSPYIHSFPVGGGRMGYTGTDQYKSSDEIKGPFGREKPEGLDWARWGGVLGKFNLRDQIRANCLGDFVVKYLCMGHFSHI